MKWREFLSGFKLVKVLVWVFSIWYCDISGLILVILLVNFFVDGEEYFLEWFGSSVSCFYDFDELEFLKFFFIVINIGVIVNSWRYRY